MPRRVSEAAVIVSADTEKFERQMKGELQDEAVEGGRRVGRRFSESMSEETRRRLAGDLPDDVERVSRRAGAEAEREMGRAGRRAGERLGEETARGARGGFERLRRVWRRVVVGGMVAGAVFAAQRIVRSVGRGLRRAADLIERGGARNRLREAFENLATAAGVDPVEALEQLQEATRNTQTEFELLERASTALQAGLPATGAELAEIAGLTRRLAQGSLVDANEAFRRFINGVIRGRRILLDDIGIIVDFGRAHQDFADRVGKTVEELTEQEKIQARLIATLNSAREVVSRQGEEVDNAALSLERMQTAAQNWINRTTELLAQAPHLTQFLRGLAEDADAAGRSIEENAVRSAAALDVAFTSIGVAFIESARLIRSSAMVIVNSIRAIRDAMMFDFSSAAENMKRAVSEDLTQAWSSFEKLVTTTPGRLEEQWRESVEGIRQFIRESREGTAFEATLGRQFGRENLEQLRSLIGSLENEQAELRAREGDHQERIQRLQGLINAAKRREAKIEQGVAEARGRSNEALRENVGLSKASLKLIDRQLDAAVARAEAESSLLDFARAVRKELEKQTDAREEAPPLPEGVERVDLGGVEQRVRQAQRELEPLLKSTETGAEDVLEVLDKWNVTLEDLREQGISTFADLVEFVIRFREEEEGAKDETNELANELSKVAAVASGVLEAADAMGELDRETQRALRSVTALVNAAAQIASGNIVAGIAQGLPALGNIVSTLIGGREDTQELARQRRELENSLQNLRLSAEAAARALNQLTGEEFAGISEALEQFLQDLEQAESGPLPGGGSAVGELEAIEALRRRLEAMGISVEEFLDRLRAMGIEVDDLEAAFKGGSFSAEQLSQEAEAALEQLEQLELERLFEGFEGAMREFEDRVELFDIEDPIEKLEMLRETFLEFAEIPPEFEEALGSIDLSTEEGRARFEEIMQRLFEMMVSGELTTEELGELTLDEFRDLIKQMEGLTDQVSEGGAGSGTTEAFQVTRSITEVSANRMISVLTTISVHARQRNRMLSAIASALGASVPDAVPPPSRPPNTGGGTTVQRGGDTTINFEIPREAVVIEAGGRLDRKDGREAARGFWEVTDKKLAELERKESRSQGNATKRPR